MYRLIIWSVTFLLLFTSVALASTQGFDAERLKEIQLLSKSEPKIANQKIELWLESVPLEQLAIREKLITTKAFNLMILSDYAQAEQLLNDWIDEIWQTDTALATRSVEILGAINMRLGNNIEAAEYLGRSLALADEHQQPEWMITSRIYSAMQAIYTGNYDAAMELFLLARELNEHYQYDYLRVNIENNINSLLIRLGLYEEALTGLYASLSDEAFLPADRIFVHQTIARSYIALEKYDQAIPHAEMALQGYIDREDPFYTSGVYLILAEIALHQQRLDDAKVLLFAALEIAEQHQLNQLLADTYLLLSRMHRDNQQFEQALKAIELHLKYFKTYHNEQANLQLAQLRNQVDSLQKVHHIAQLEQDLALSDLKTSHQRRISWLVMFSFITLTMLLLFLVRVQKRKRFESEQFSHQLELSYNELKQTQRQLIASEKMAATSGMVAGFAHELNTPLGIVTTALSVNKDRLLTLEQKMTSGLTKHDFTDFLQASRSGYTLCEDNVERCVRLVNTFKQLAIERSDTLSRFKLHTLISDLTLLMESSLQQRNLQVFQRGTDMVLHADKQHFQLLLMELISNSIQHGFQDRSDGKIEIALTLFKDDWSLSYQDNGRGLDSGMHDHLFVPFYTTSRHAGHLGLGLNRVYNLVTLALDGEIELNSVDTGFSLTCRFPNRWLASPKH